ncbi:hypothetical protein ACFX4I_22260 [Peribacillus sp. YIM B13472]|uniref:hypothetical protein n=1 Tax=Peribacillus sp. YIM B13472 TaxID=3366297 RepID=UPI003671228F
MPKSILHQTTRHKAKACMPLIACRDSKLKDIRNLHVITVGNDSKLMDIKHVAASIPIFM